MKLYGSYTSPYVRHCRIALAETNTPYDFVETDHDGSARQTPAMRVPFMQVDDTHFTDSLSILHWIYQQAGQDFLLTPDLTERYAMANTACDTLINIALLKCSGLDPTDNAYLQRQEARLAAVLYELEALPLPTVPNRTDIDDPDIRLACFLDWALYRQLITLDDSPRLAAFLTTKNAWKPFPDTAPPPLS